MSVPAPKGLALTGSIMSIVVGALMLIGGIMALGARGPDFIKIVGIVGAILGTTGVVLGSIGCTIKPGVILANAIVFSVMTLLGLVGLAGGRDVHPIQLLSLLLYATTTVFLWIGFPQAARYKRAQEEGEG